LKKKTGKLNARMSAHDYPVVDLFAGPGGLGEGFSSVRRKGKAGFRSIVAIEEDQYAHQTLHLRHFIREFRDERIPQPYYDYIAAQITREQLKDLFPSQWRAAEESALRVSLGKQNHEKVQKLLKKKLRGHRKWVLVGGPPCQAYSLVGRSRRAKDPNFEKDEKHFLYREYLKIIIDHRPPVFVMENVKGLLSSTIAGKPVISRILSDLAQPKAAISGTTNGLNYRLFSLTERGELLDEKSPKSFIVRAEEHGVPQARHRMFILGIRSDLDVEPGVLRRNKAPSVEDIIGDLPRLRSGISKEPDSFDLWADIVTSTRDESWFKKAFSYRSIPGKKKLPTNRASWEPTRPKVMATWFAGQRQKYVSGHEARSHMRSDLQRYLFSALAARQSGISPKLADFPTKLLPKHKNVAAGKAGKMFSDRFRVQVAGRVSTTVTSHISKDGHYFIHYDPAQCRSLTVREAARLQTFPDNYHFEGPRTQQYHQVGNAVPPYLAAQIAKIVADLLDRMGD